ncbi:MAG: (Fe-S)-binding protein, partial [Chloroflexi bacterium]|nr:(Fe-S)-binding protein [Chloroflexota bacterium]
MTTIDTPPRVRLRPGPLAAQYGNMEACIRCGLCLSVCPTYQTTLFEEESPRGRIAMAKALAEGHLDATRDLRRHEASCLVCEACTAICPTGVRMEELQVALRTQVVETSRPPLAGRLALAWLFPHMALFRAAFRLLWLYQRSGLQAAARGMGLLRAPGLAAVDALLPPVPSHFLAPRGQLWGTGGRRVALFAGCVMSTLFAETDRNTADVLSVCGCSVEATAGQGCCGALHAHTGDTPRARRLAQRNIAAFERSPTK